MLSKTNIDGLMLRIKEKGRYLDYCLIANLFQCEQIILVEELKKYQNDDGGFGHGLEPDVRMPSSNIVSTNEAVLILKEIDNEPFKQKIYTKIVSYYEKTYIDEINAWELVPKEVDDFPRAAWWNYDLKDTFSYGNPNPQIIGFLYEHKKLLKKIDIDLEIERVIDYILNVFPEESSKHNLLSCLMFYTYMPLSIKEKIYDTLQVAVDKELKNDDWRNYSLQPYEIKLIAPEFLEKHQELLDKNLAYIQAKIEKGLVMPNWKWGQFEDVFETIKYEWAGYITFTVIKALLT